MSMWWALNLGLCAYHKRWLLLGAELRKRTFSVNVAETIVVACLMWLPVLRVVSMSILSFVLLYELWGWVYRGAPCLVFIPQKADGRSRRESFPEQPQATKPAQHKRGVCCATKGKARGAATTRACFAETDHAKSSDHVGDERSIEQRVTASTAIDTSTARHRSAEQRLSTFTIYHGGKQPLQAQFATCHCSHIPSHLPMVYFWYLFCLSLSSWYGSTQSHHWTTGKASFSYSWWWPEGW